MFASFCVYVLCEKFRQPSMKVGETCLLGIRLYLQSDLAAWQKDFS